MINVINKGKRFERDTAAYLSSQTKSPWHRVPNSGGLSASHTNIAFQGDVYNDTQYKNVVVECKSWNKMSINELWSDKSKFHKAIQQAEDESKGLPWLLFIKINNLGSYMINKHQEEFIIKSMGLIDEDDGCLDLHKKYYMRKVTMK